MCSVLRASNSGLRRRRRSSPVSDQFRRAAASDRFTGKSGSSLELIAPPGLDVPRLIVVGTGKERDLKDRDLVKLGGVAMGRVPRAASQATIVAEFGAGPLKPEQIADLVLGTRLRAYRFDRYKTKPQGGGGAGEKSRSALCVRQSGRG